MPVGSTRSKRSFRRPLQIGGGFEFRRFLRYGSASARPNARPQDQVIQQHVAKSALPESDDSRCPPPICNGLQGRLIDELAMRCALVDSEALHGVRAVTTPGIGSRLDVAGEFGNDSLPKWSEPVHNISRRILQARLQNLAGAAGSTSETLLLARQQTARPRG